MFCYIFFIYICFVLFVCFVSIHFYRLYLFCFHLNCNLFVSMYVFFLHIPPCYSCGVPGSK